MLISLFFFLTISLLQLATYPFALRVLFRFHQVDYYNQLTQSILQLSSKPVSFFKKLAPTTKFFDGPAFIWAFLMTLAFTALKKYTFSSEFNAADLVILGFLELGNIFIFLYLMSGAIFAIASFFQIHNPNTKIFAQLIAGQLNTLRKFNFTQSSSPIDLSFCLWWLALLSLNFSLEWLIMKI